MQTRRLLLDAARYRFATNGYDATTVRDISEDAGVNVALISRYFQSKEGLFRECVVGAVDQLGDAVPKDMSLEQVPTAIARQLAGPGRGSQPNQLLLLLRSSKDPQAEQIRVDILRSFAERLASIAGWRPDAPEADQIMLRAQVALSAALGLALLRATSNLEPLTSAGEEDLIDPLQVLISALLNQD